MAKRVNKNSQDYKDGYQAALEQLKKIAQGDNSNVSDGAGDGNSSLTIPQEAFDKAQQEGGQQGNQQGQSGDKNASPKSGGQQGNQQGNQQGSSSSLGGSRTNPNDSSQGIVRPEDCCSNNSGVQSTPSTAGGFFDKSEGDKLAKSEGYDKEGGSDSTVEQEWKDASLKAANNINSKPGDAWGRMKSTIEGLYKVQHDWKKALKYVVGRSINPEDTRQAYANKNILVSQDRIARTDKDRYDNMDYLLAVIDTSASIDDERLRILLTEVYGIALTKKPMKIVIMQCDTKVQDIVIYNNLKDFKDSIKITTAKGRGGTDMGDVWKVIRTDKRFMKHKPDLTIIFTDSDSTNRQYPRDKKHMNHLVWCILDCPSFNLKYHDSMTKIIHIKSEDIK